MQIANIYINDCGSDDFIVLAFRQLANDANLPSNSVSDAVRKRFVDCGESFGPDPDLRAQALALPVPGPPAPPQLPQAPREYAEHFARLQQLRTPISRDRGRLLAVAAQQMAGWFLWVP